MSEGEQTESVDLVVAKNQVADTLAWASVAAITTESEWIHARELRRDVALLEKKIEAHFKRMKKPWDEGKKKILDIEKEYAVPVESAIELLDQKILTYEKQYFTERNLLASQAQANERQRAEEERKQMVEEFTKAGDELSATQLLAQPLNVPNMVLAEYSGWLPGEGRNYTWGADEEKIDIIKLCKAVVAGEVSPSCVSPNMKVLNTLAKALKETFNVPGVPAKEKPGITQRQPK